MVNYVQVQLSAKNFDVNMLLKAPRSAKQAASTCVLKSEISHFLSDKMHAHISVLRSSEDNILFGCLA